jgi:Domain of unknown function (DUF4386)
METARSAGRMIGVLIIIQMVAGGIVNFVLEAPLFGAPGFLVNAAAHSQQLGLAALLGLVMEGLWLGVTILAFPIFAQRSQSMALGLIALAAVVLALAAAENAAVMSMLSLSEAYTKAGAADQEQFQIVKIVVASARNWAHYTARIFDGVLIFVFYLVLYRFALVPRALAGFGLIAATLMVAGVALPLFGHHVVFPLLAPLGLSQLILALWLMAKGFRDAENALSAGSKTAF